MSARTKHFCTDKLIPDDSRLQSNGTELMAPWFDNEPNTVEREKEKEILRLA